MKLLSLCVPLLYMAAVPARSQVMPAKPADATPSLSITRFDDSSFPSSATLQISLPGNVVQNTLHIYLNGKDVRELFQNVSCSTVCLSASISVASGARDGQNAIYAYSKTLNGRMLSVRFPFDLANGVKASAASVGVARPLVKSEGATTGAPDGGSTFLPPTVTFQTLNRGGWIGPGTPWLQIGSRTYPTSSTPACDNNYEVLVFDPQTLAEKTASPESSPQCVSSGANLSKYLHALPTGDLVVVGTNQYHSADAGLDTTAIGGTNYTADPNHTEANRPPTGYMAIGAVGSVPGSAYENYLVDTKGDTSFDALVNYFATGLLQEDTNGNYNFQSSDVREFKVDPMDADPTSSVVGTITVEASEEEKVSTGVQSSVFVRPATHYASGGYWLLILDRATLVPLTPNAAKPEPCAGSVQVGNVLRWSDCGFTFATGDSDPNVRADALEGLATSLNHVGPYQLAILTSYGTPACCAGNVFNMGYQPNFEEVELALEALGASHPAALFANNPTHQAFTYITSRGLGDPLTGSSVLSSTDNASYGQYGYVHGALARNQNGLYQPSQSSQQVNAADDTAAGPDYTLLKASLKQPVGWPEFSDKLLPGASSAAGQAAAYRYVSYTLLTERYIKGAVGPHLDDIHYYFTGSNSNYINYHFFDPVNLAFPGQSGTSFTWTDPVTSVQLAPFTQNDFAAVTSQVSTEVVDLVNVLNYMVNGPVNLKDAVAAGSASAGVALTGAAAAILGSALHPAPSTPVKANVANILGLISGVASIVSAVSTDGSIGLNVEKLANRINKGASTIGAAFSVASAVTGGLQTGGDTPSNGSRYQAFATTIGSLASSALQGQLAIGLDLEVDSVLSDWGKLNTLGPLVTDTTNVTFYSPNQVAQNAAIYAIGLGAQRSYFLSLLPTVYSMHFWPGVQGIDQLDYPNNTLTNQPDMAPLSGGCTDAFYLNKSFAPAYSFLWSPTTSGYRYPSNTYSNDHPIDMYVIAAQGQNVNHGTTKVAISTLSQDLGTQLFSPTALGIPQNEFVARNGPLSSQWYDMSSGQLANVTGWNPAQICSGRAGTIYDGPTNAPKTSVSELPIRQADQVTTTALQVPSSVLLGETVSLKATVKHDTTPVTVGSILFQTGGATIAEVPLDATGSASLAQTLALGTYTYQATYSRVSPYDTSSSIAANFTVYADAPNLAITLSQPSLQFSLGTTSPPVMAQVTSSSGFTGAVTFSCSGLPAGMACVFDSPTATLNANSSVTTNLIITSESTSKAGVGGTGILAIFSGLSFVVVWRARQKFRLACASVLTLLLVLGFTTGCAGPAATPAKTASAATILVNVTCGTITKSTPLLVVTQ